MTRVLPASVAVRYLLTLGLAFLPLTTSGCVTYMGIEQGSGPDSYLVCEIHNYVLFSTSKIVEYHRDPVSGMLVATRRVR